MSTGQARFEFAGEVVASDRMAIQAALASLPGKVYLPDDNDDVNYDVDGFSVSIYPADPAPEGGRDFLMTGYSFRSDEETRDVMTAFVRALESRALAAHVELTGPTPDDIEIFDTAAWDGAMARRRAAFASPAVVLGPQLRTGSGDEVRTGMLGTQPVLVTLTTRHIALHAQLADELRLAFEGIAPLESIGNAQPPYDDMMIERLPPGRPASEVAQLSVQSLAQLGAAVAEVLAKVHAAKHVVDGVQPELIYVGDDGRFTGLVPRGPRFITSAPQPVRGLRSYRVPYLGHEVLVLGKPAGPATDVFALCASLFVLGHGTHPFGDPANLGQLVARVAADQRETWPQGGALGQLLVRGLAQRPEDRPTAAVLAGELALIASGAR